MLNPTYADYATHDESQFPGLWDGCVLASAPLLGATGSRMFDLSRRQTWGTLTAMAPASDWIVSNGQMALEFDGSDQGVSFGIPPSWMAFSNTTPFTASLWFFNTGQLAGNTFPAVITQNGSTGRFGWGIYINKTTNVIDFAVSRAGTGSNVVSVSGTTNTWTHVALQFTTTSLIAYVNGSQVGSTAYTFGAAAAVDREWFLGRDNDATLRGFKGYADDLMLYNRVTSPSEIRLLASRRGIAYQRRKRRYAFAQQATGRRRRLLLTGQT